MVTFIASSLLQSELGDPGEKGMSVYLARCFFFVQNFSNLMIIFFKNLFVRDFIDMSIQ